MDSFLFETYYSFQNIIFRRLCIMQENLFIQ